MENVDHRVAVVGAGYAGMAAAVTLAGKGVPVTVFESGPVPGGRARRVRVSLDGRDTELDNGQHILIGAYSTLFGLMRAVGVPDEAVLRLPLEIRYPGRFRLSARRLGLLGGLLGARGMPVRERLGALRFLSRLRASGFHLDEDMSVDRLLERHDQAGAIAHYLWRPLCVSALNTPIRTDREALRNS